MTGTVVACQKTPPTELQIPATVATLKCSTISPGNPFILRSKDQGREVQKNSAGMSF